MRISFIRLLLGHVAVALSSGVVAQDAIEEIVVTGSYIPRHNFSLPAPVDVISLQDILDQGSFNMGDVLKSIPYNYGTANVTNPGGPSPQDANENLANLRGLGSTLTLLNGRRTVSDNAAWIYPRIAIERIDILKDGGSALYGNEAVAGVVNYIPRSTFQGVEMMAYGLVDDGADYRDMQLGAIWGRVFNRTHAMVAMEYRDVSRLKQIDRPDYARAQVGVSGAGNPGTHFVPTRTAVDVDGDGSIAADEVLLGPPASTPDPGCENPANTITDVTKHGAFRSGIRRVTPGFPPGCDFDFREFFDYVPDSTQLTSMATIRHELSDDLALHFEALVVYFDDGSRLSPSIPGWQTQTFDPVVGDHPGNPFRAFVDRNGNDVVDENLGDPLSNETLFAQDANGNGIPDRDLDGDGVADPGAEANAAATVLLASSPFDSAAGVPFNEDVQIIIRPVGKGPRSLPGVLTNGASRFENDTWRSRFTGGLESRIPGTSWRADLALTADRTSTSFKRAYQRFSTLQAGLTARVVNDQVVGNLGAGGDRFYNPFSTSQNTCVNRVCGPDLTDPSSPAFISQDVADQLTFNNHQSFEDALLAADLVLTGDLFALPAGPVQAAFGTHVRRLQADADYSDFQNICDAWGEDCQPDNHDDNRYWAMFFELAIPLMDHPRWGVIESQLAGRYSEHTTSDSDSFDPKIAVRYQPTPFVALRGSYSTAFVAPLEQTRADQSVRTQFRDETCRISGACPANLMVGITTIRDVDNLRPEDSTSWNVGLSLRFLEDAVGLDLDYIVIDFDDRLTSPFANDIVQLDGERFQRFFDDNTATMTPTEIRDAWIDPTNKATGNFESQDIIRDATGIIQQILTPRLFNATNMTFKGLDFRITATLDSTDLPWMESGFGLFDFSVTTTYVDEYSYQLVPTSAEVQGAGRRNWSTGAVPPIPRWRAHGRLSWLLKSHSVNVFGHFTGEVDDDSRFATNFGADENIDSLTTWDMQYNYTAERLLGDGTTTFTLGLHNLFDEMSDPTLAFGGLETFLHDPRGRMIYARIGHAM